MENNRAPLLYYIKLFAAFLNHRYIQTGVTVRKRSIWVKICDFLSRVTLKIDGWLWKTIGHLSYAASSFVHNFIAIGEFKLELQSGNPQSGSKSTFFRRVTLKFDGWHYNDVIMTTMEYQITSLTVVYAIVYSEADQRKHQSSASLAFVLGIHRDRWIPRTEGQLRGKCFHLMTS